MSLYDKASLIMTPSGAKATKLYSHKPHNGNGDFTHNRSTTATRVNKDGLIESVAADVPRLDYPLIDGVVQDCPALLLEPARTNILRKSQEIDDSTYWIKGNSNVTANDTISPDGTQNADLLTLTSAGGNIYSPISTTGTHSFSVFAKYVDMQYIRVRLTGAYVFFDIKNGVIGSSINNDDSKIEDYGNGWYRCTVIDDNTNTIAQVYVSDTDGSYTGTGSVHLWGLQVESGSYPTSYIPTTTQTVTRNADVCNSAGTSAEFNDSEGVLYWEAARQSSSHTASTCVAISNGATIDTAVSLYYFSTGIYADIFNTSTAFGLSYTYAIEKQVLFNRMAVKYKSGDVALWLNGFEVDTDTTTFSFGDSFDQLAFDYGSGSFPFHGRTKELAVFKEALTDSELESLTSWDSFNEMATEQEYTIE